MNDEVSGWHLLRAQLEAKDKWELEHIVNAALEQARRETIPASTWLEAHLACHLLMERASMHSTRQAS